eukprot:s314_g10.t1
MTPKIPPSFDGQSSWFEFEDLIDDWVNITTLSAEKLGPSLKNALTGNAEYYKKMLDNEQLRHERNGITYFKETLRPYFVKGANHVFLWRFMQLFRTWRGNGEFVSWIARFEVASKKVMEAFMGLLDLSTVPQPDDFNFTDILSQQQYMLLQGLQDPAERREAAERIRSEHIDALKQAHRDTFPLSDNLMSLIFLVQSDLNEQQRERFVASMALRQINMSNYTYLGVKGLFLDLFCGTATGTADPSIRRQRRCTFLVLDEGDLEEESGYWVMDQETGEEGFVSLFSESEFWVFLWKRQEGKKGGKKGFKGKDAFKGKGTSKQQNPFQQANVATAEEPSSAQPTSNAEETWSAHEANWSWDSYGYHTDQYYPEDVWQANEATWQQWTYFADGQTDRPQDEEHHSSEPRPDQMNQSADFRYYGTHAEEMTGEEHVSHQYHLNPAGSSTDYRHSGCSEVIDPRFCSSFVNFDDGFHHALLSEYIDLRHYNASKIDFSFEPSSSRFSFANGEQSNVREKLVIYFQNDQSPTGWITTAIDILDQGDVPILFSVEQLKNLRVSIEHTPVGDYLTCPLFGLKRFSLPVSTSNHNVLDIMMFASSVRKPNHSFTAINPSYAACPACNGKHRKHTYKDGRKKAETSEVKEDKSAADNPAKKTEKHIASGDAKVDPPSKLISMPPPAKKVTPPTYRKTEKSPDFGTPFEHSKIPSSSTGAEKPDVPPAEPDMPVKPDPQEESKEDVKPIPTTVHREKKAPKVSVTLPLALQRIHEKLSHPTELLKLHLKHYHMSTEQFKKRTSALKIPAKIYEEYEKAVTEDPSRYEITYRQLLRQASLARNSMVTFGGVSPLEMAFGRRPADLLYPENMTPEELTASLPSPEKNIDAVRTLAMKSYLEAKQSDDLRRDISARLQLSDGPFYPGDKIYYWTEDKSKVKSDGTHSGKWIKGKVISSDGSMVGIDLGTRILKVNISKVRKDINPIEDVEVPLDPVALLSSESARTDIPVTDHASSLVQSDGAQIGVEGFTYSSYAWQPVMTGKIDILELFAGSARLSQVAAMNGLRVGQPIDLRTGLDILTSDGRKRTMDIIEKQKPKVIFMAPHCAPWSQMTNIHDRAARDQRRQKPVQMPVSPSPPTVPPSNHLGGDDRLVFSPPVVRTPKKRKPEGDPDDDIPEFPEDEDARDPDAQPSGPSLPIADDDDGQPVSPESPEAVIVDSDIPDDVAVNVEEEEEEDDVDSDETIDYNDLYVDENSWSWLSAEQKLCSNTGSFTVPRYIDGSPVDLKTEATQQEKRQFAKQFLEAKQAECKSWFDNDVFELVDMRKLKIRNYVAGRWVLTIKKDKDGFRCATQFAANCQWDLYHMDLKTAFLQGEAYDETRDIIFQIPSECGYPPHIGAKKSAYGLNDAPRRWWQVVDKALLSYGLVPTRADRCTYILYGDKMSSKDTSLSKSFRKRSTSNDPVQDAIDMLLDPVAQNNAQGRRPHGFICLHVDDLFMAGDKVFADKVLASIRKDFNVGSEDKNDIMFVDAAHAESGRRFIDVVRASLSPDAGRKGTGRHSGRDQSKGKAKGKRSPSREERAPSVELVPRESIRPTQSTVRGYRLHTMIQGGRPIVTQIDEIHEAGARGTSSRGPSQPADRRRSGGKGKRPESRNAEGRYSGQGKGKSKDTSRDAGPRPSAMDSAFDRPEYGVSSAFVYCLQCG